MKKQTPYYIFNPNVLKQKYLLLKSLFKRCSIAYAVKANPHSAVIKQLCDLDSSYELASINELQQLLSCGVSIDKIAFGSATKIPSHIEFFAEKGVKLFAVDSLDEVEKIAKFAPDSNIYVRVLVDSNSHSTYTLSKKFGASKNDVLNIATYARKKGLNVTGLSFNVGSQALNSQAWGQGINELHQLMLDFAKKDIHIESINIGGGFPIQYSKQLNIQCPDMNDIAQNINNAMSTLPYSVDLIIEPGRFLVAESFTAFTKIFSKKMRGTNQWIFTDMGVYQGLFEALACQGSIQYEVQNISRQNNGLMQPFVVAGPTCDDLDIICDSTLLPADTSQGDILKILSVGAYSLPLTTSFNGFEIPIVIVQK